MVDYYQILQIPRSASADQIRRAYKRLAVKYHPDKHAGNIIYEELFKQINEAYQILKNEESRRRYDLQWEYHRAVHASAPRSRPVTPPAREEKSVYDRYGRYDWRKAPRYSEATHYRIDRNYYRDVAISFAIMIILGIIMLGATAYNNHLNEQEKLFTEQRNSQHLSIAQNLYDHQEYERALEMLHQLYESQPMEVRFYSQRNLFIDNLNRQAIQRYENEDFKAAILNFEILNNYQSPPRLSNWKLMADSYMQLQDYPNAIRAYEFLLSHNTQDLDLLLTLAELHEKTGNEAKELDYYNAARLTFKEYQELSYGAAYEFIIKPADIPEAYFKMFKKRAELMIKSGDYEQAIKDCNWGIFLRPDRSYLYYVRAQAKHKAGMSQRSCYDVQRAVERGYPRNEIKIPVDCGSF